MKKNKVPSLQQNHKIVETTLIKVCTFCRKATNRGDWIEFQDNSKKRVKRKGNKLEIIREIPTKWRCSECAKRFAFRKPPTKATNEKRDKLFQNNLNFLSHKSLTKVNKRLKKVEKNFSPINKEKLFKVLRLVKNWGEAEKHRIKITDYKNSILNSAFSFLYNDWSKQQIQEAKSIEQIDRLDQWSVWEPKTRKARIIYVGVPFFILIVWFSIWKWNLIKKYKDWYNDPGELDETEKEWYKSMEEEEEDV